MDYKEILQVADIVSKEKGISRDEVLTALEEGIETSLRKDFAEGADIRIHIDTASGQVKSYRAFQLVDSIENVENQMLFSEVEDEIVEDGYLYEPFNFVMDRQKFNITKQVALQKIKQSSRDHQIEDLLNQRIAVFEGSAKVIKREQIIVDCKGLDITIPRRNMLHNDNFKNGDKVYFALEKEKNQYVGTRISEDFLSELFKNEIVQIEEGNIEIVSVARIPGFRSKVIVKSLVRNTDAAKVCIGAKGIHVNAVRNLLNGEFIDIINDNSDIAQLVVNVFDPIVITSIVIDEETSSMDIAVKDEDIAKAIGKGGKNVELISKLIGWELNVMSNTQWQKKSQLNEQKIAITFEAGLECDNEVAQLLVNEGFTSFEEIAYVPRNEFDVDVLDDDTIDALRERAKAILNDPVALAKSLGIGELLVLGFEDDERLALQNNGVFGNKDVADLATFELVEFLPALDEAKAKNIIMQARKTEPSFTEVETETA